MIDTELLTPGTKVRIVDSWEDTGDSGAWWAPNNEMDHWLGRVMTIRRIPRERGGWYKMEEDAAERGSEGWVWKPSAFAYIVDDRPEPEDSGMAFGDLFGWR